MGRASTEALFKEALLLLFESIGFLMLMFFTDSIELKLARRFPWALLLITVDVCVSRCPTRAVSDDLRMLLV